METDVLLLDEKTCLARYGMKRSSFRIWAERCGAAVKLDGCKRYAWKLLDAEVERQLAEKKELMTAAAEDFDTEDKEETRHARAQR